MQFGPRWEAEAAVDTETEIILISLDCLANVSS